jgi:hypothetical protein
MLRVRNLHEGAGWHGRVWHVGMVADLTIPRGQEFSAEVKISRKPSDRHQHPR